jgi:hypothetical protein
MNDIHAIVDDLRDAEIDRQARQRECVVTVNVIEFLAQLSLTSSE